MNILKNLLNMLKRPAGAILTVAIIASIVLTFLAYRQATQGPKILPTPVVHTTVRPTATPSPTPTPAPSATPTPTSTPTPAPIILPSQDPSNILGIDSGGPPGNSYPGLTWFRMGHPSCGGGNLQGQVLKDAIQELHRKGERVLLTVCQMNTAPNLFDPNVYNDIAQAYPDAVQCGNEEMKQDASVSPLYLPPDQFARFYDICEHAIHSVQPNVPVLVGSLDPHVAGADYQLLVDQANYLDQMQNAMNTTIHPGGNWDWHNQALGLIDSWHNGYWGANNLAGLFSFWAQQFHVDVNSGELGKHLWVVEGTGCFKGCGLDPYNNAQVAAAHVFALITDVRTSMQSHVPFFFFSGKDFRTSDSFWPIGILDVNGNSKPIRQDLPMGARTLSMTCPDGSNPSVADQLQLLVKLYNRCTLPSNYISILDS